jgi:hypothetical protein
MLPEAVKAYGLLDGLLYLFNRFSARFLGKVLHVTRYQFLALPTNSVIPVPRRLGQSIETRYLGAAEIEALRLPRPTNVIQSRFRQGSSCLGAFKGDQFLGFIWLQESSLLEDEVRCRYILPIRGHCVWDYDLYIDPAFRNTGAFLKLWLDTVTILKSTQKHWSLSRVSVFAPNSLRAHIRMGAQPVGQAGFISLFRLQIMAASLPPYFHISWDSARIPNLKMRAPD